MTYAKEYDSLNPLYGASKRKLARVFIWILLTFVVAPVALVARWLIGEPFKQNLHEWLIVISLFAAFGCVLLWLDGNTRFFAGAIGAGFSFVVLLVMHHMIGYPKPEKRPLPVELSRLQFVPPPRFEAARLALRLLWLALVYVGYIIVAPFLHTIDILVRGRQIWETPEERREEWVYILGGLICIMLSVSLWTIGAKLNPPIFWSVQIFLAAGYWFNSHRLSGLGD